MPRNKAQGADGSQFHAANLPRQGLRGRGEPTLYVTDQDNYIVQGYVVTDDEILTKLDIPDGETVVEVHDRLFRHLAKDGVTGTVKCWVPPIVHVKDNGNCIVQGVRLDDDDARRQMTIPGNEDAVEVSKAAILTLL